MGEYHNILFRNSYEKSIEAIRDAEYAFNDKRRSMTLNRIYYTIFYSVNALSYKDGFSTSKHLQLLGWFNKKYINQEKVFSKEMGGIYKSAFLNRQEADYSMATAVKMSDDQILDALNNARLFVEQIFDHLNVEFPENQAP